MKWTSLESLSGFATATEHLRLRAMLRALASCGRSSSASAPLSVSILVNSATIRSPFACAKRSNASRWASSPRPTFFPDRACFSVANPIVGNDRLHAGTSAAMGYFGTVVGALPEPFELENSRRYKRAKQAEHGHPHAPGRVVCRQDAPRQFVPTGAPCINTRARCATGALTLWLHILASFIACSVGVIEAPHSQTNYPREGKALVRPQNVPSI